VAEQRLELPQRRISAGRLQRAVQLDLQGPGEQHVAGNADDDRFRVDARARVAHRLRVAHRFAIDRLAQQQERLDRKALRESSSVMIEILGHRRTLEVGQELAEPGVQLVAAAIGQHAELPRAHHAGRDVAVAKAVAHELALQMPRGRAPTVRPQAGGNGHELRATLRMPRREHHADHAAKTGADPRDRNRAAAAVEPGGDQIGEARHGNELVRTGIVETAPDRSVARPRGAEHGVLRRIDQIGCAQRGPPRGTRVIAGRFAVTEWKRRRGDAADDQDRRRGAELRTVDPAAKLHVFERAPFDRERLMVDDQPPRTQVGGCQGGHDGIV